MFAFIQKKKKRKKKIKLKTLTHKTSEELWFEANLSNILFNKLICHVYLVTLHQPLFIK